MKEKISALCDAELDPREQEDLFRALRVDPDLRKTWERYHLMRAAVRRELDTLVSPALADRIAQRIHAEPDPSLLYRITLTPAARSLGGLALAASVAAVAILGLQWALPRAPLGGGFAGMDTQVVALESATADDVAPDADADGKLDSFLVQHHAFTRNAGMNGLLSYVRVAGNSTKTAGSNE